jgi:hypothetical protein
MPIAWAFDERKRRYVLLLCLIFACVLAFTFSIIAVNASGIGGYISEKVIARAGVLNSNLRIARQGVNNSYLDIGMGPRISLSAPSSVLMNNITLNGAVISLNAFPSVGVWFEWGYDLGYANSTPIQIINAVGAVSAVVNGIDPTKTFYYRFVGMGDGTIRTSGGSIPPTSAGEGTGQSFNLLYLLLTLIIAMAVIVGVLVRLGTPIKLLMFIIVGIALLLSVIAALSSIPR